MHHTLVSSPPLSAPATSTPASNTQRLFQPTIPMAAAAASKGGRGAFIVFEGLDRSGKSTQVQRLVDSLNGEGIRAVACRFPGKDAWVWMVDWDWVAVQGRRVLDVGCQQSGVGG